MNQQLAPQAPQVQLYRGSEYQIRNYIAANQGLDPIEGIWHLSGMWRSSTSAQGAWDASVAIVRDSVNAGEFVEVALAAQDGFPILGIGARFTKSTSPGTFVTQEFRSDGSSSFVTLSFNDTGELVGQRTDYVRGQTVESLYRYIKLAPREATPQQVARSGKTGSGFLIRESGIVVTNQHVIDGASEITVRFPQTGLQMRGRVIVQDAANDLALIRLEHFGYGRFFTTPIPFAIESSAAPALGEEVFTLGFPYGESLGSKAKLSAGRISSLSGMNDDPRVFQVSNPVQPGNSGGPLFDRKGNLIGVIVATLDAKFVLDRTGTIPQNVNFAVKASYLSPLLEAVGERGGRSAHSAVPAKPSLEAVTALYLPYVVEVTALSAK